MIHYTYKDWETDKHKIAEIIDQHKQPHIVALYRGSLGMGTEFSNICNAPLSIGKFQSYDGDDKEFDFIYNAGISSDETIIILDDICDSGNTLIKAYDYFHKNFPENNVYSITIYGKAEHTVTDPLRCNMYLHEHVGKWISFPWETL